MSLVLLDSTYRWDHKVFDFPCLTLFTWRNALKVHPCCRWQDFFLYGWRILPCTYVSQFLYPFLCRWTLRLFPCLGCCKWCCSEHGGCRYFFEITILFPVDIYPELELLDPSIFCHPLQCSHPTPTPQPPVLFLALFSFNTWNLKPGIFEWVLESILKFYAKFCVYVFLEGERICKFHQIFKSLCKPPPPPKKCKKYCSAYSLGNLSYSLR